MTAIYFPNKCDEVAVFSFCNEINACSGQEKIVIDFSRMGRVEPFTMIYIAKFIGEFNRENEKTVIQCFGYESKEYAANMGFFKAFGLNHGKAPSSTQGNSRFIPFTIMSVHTINDEAGKNWMSGQDVIEKRSKQLAEILSQEEGTTLVDTLTYSIREIMRNVYEHSHSEKIAYCAQYWPTYHKVEISIADKGIGLRKSLKNNPFIDIESDSDAIQQALMPAISSKNYEGNSIDKDDPWHNSGFGLYMSSRICRLGGSFLICSGSHGIKLTTAEKEHMELNHFCSGTVVRMVLDTSKLTELTSMLTMFREDGYEIAKNIKGVGMYTASAASQMLSRDFKK